MSLLSTEPIRLLFSLLCIIAFVGGNAAYLVLAERKGAGRIQNRPGPNEAGYGGWLQPVADVIKLLSKQLMVPPDADRILFRVAPLVVQIRRASCRERV